MPNVFDSPLTTLTSRWSMKQIEPSSLTWGWQSFSAVVSTLPSTWETRPIQLRRFCSITARGTSAQTSGRWVRSSPSSVPGYDFTHPLSVRPRSGRPWRNSRTAKPYARWWRVTPLVGPPWAGSLAAYEGLGMWLRLLLVTLSSRRITFEPLRLALVPRIVPHRQWTEDNLQLEENRGSKWRGPDLRFTRNPRLFKGINHQWRGLDHRFTRIHRRWRGLDLHSTGIRPRWNMILCLYTGLRHLFTKMHHQQDHTVHPAKSGKGSLLGRKTKNKDSHSVSPTCHRILHN